jgi:hypothetical protein
MRITERVITITGIITTSGLIKETCVAMTRVTITDITAKMIDLGT